MNMMPLLIGMPGGMTVAATFRVTLYVVGVLIPSLDMDRFAKKTEDDLTDSVVCDCSDS